MCSKVDAGALMLPGLCFITHTLCILSQFISWYNLAFILYPTRSIKCIIRETLLPEIVSIGTKKQKTHFGMLDILLPSTGLLIPQRFSYLNKKFRTHFVFVFIFILKFLPVLIFFFFLSNYYLSGLFPLCHGDFEI